jgi:hypothetical protein
MLAAGSGDACAPIAAKLKPAAPTTLVTQDFIFMSVLPAEFLRRIARSFSQYGVALFKNQRVENADVRA